MLTVQNLSHPAHKNAPTVESVQLLRSKLAAEREASRAMLKEHMRNEAILQQLRRLHGQSGDTADNLAFLTTDKSTQSMTNNINFALSQLPALKSLLADLRPRLAALKDANVRVESAKEEMNEERRGYIEQRTRSHLHRDGEILQGQSAAVAGARIGSDEVQALERLAVILEPT
jgi:kinetochore protein Mis12/MTW1